MRNTTYCKWLISLFNYMTHLVKHTFSNNKNMPTSKQKINNLNEWLNIWMDIGRDVWMGNKFWINSTSDFQFLFSKNVSALIKWPLENKQQQQKQAVINIVTIQIALCCLMAFQTFSRDLPAPFLHSRVRNFWELKLFELIYLLNCWVLQLTHSKAKYMVGIFCDLQTMKLILLVFLLKSRTF